MPAREGEPCATCAREREGRLREVAVSVTVIDSCGGGGGELLLRRVRANACVVSAREVMRTGHTTDRATRTDSGTRSAQVWRGGRRDTHSST